MNNDFNNQNNLNNNVNANSFNQPVVNNQVVQNSNMGTTNNMNNDTKKTNNNGKIIVIVVVCLLVICAIVFAFIFFNKKDNSNSSNNANETSEEQKTNVKKTNYHVFDYDYSSLKEGGDGSDIRIVTENYANIRYYKTSKILDEYWNDNSDVLEEIKTKTFESSNDKFIYPYVMGDEMDNRYYVFNIDNKSTVMDAFNKKWYALDGFNINNLSITYNDIFDGIELFDTAITGLGKPNCVIRSQYQLLEDEVEDEMYSESAFIIYDMGLYYLFLKYQEFKNNKYYTVDLRNAYVVLSKDMVQALINNNSNTGFLDRYKQSFIFKNKCDFELRK